MNKQQLFENIKKKQSFLCVGLDTDIRKIPQHLLKEEDPIFAFNKAIIDATAPYCIAYKPNLAFYESMGVKGWLAFEKTIQYLNANHPDQFIIADAKRGDIGNTSATEDAQGERLFEKVLRKSQEWGNDENMMYVVGATQGRMFEDIRKIAPDHFLLVPGIGAQGGSLEEVCRYGMNRTCGLIVNSSRAIIYADSTENFAAVAAEKAREVQQQMAAQLQAF